MKHYNPPSPHPERFCTACQQWKPRDAGQMVKMSNLRQRWKCDGCLERQKAREAGKVSRA